jgi:1-acyl-sn-glycerol-3-phosphate acyltransferase
MPRKVLGADPLTRLDSAQEPGKRASKSKTAGKDTVGKGSVGRKTGKKAPVRRVKLFEPSPRSSSARAGDELEDRIDKQIQSFEERLEKSLRKIGGTSEERRPVRKRAAAEAEKESGVSTSTEEEYSTSDEELASTSSLESSDEDSDLGLLGQLARMTSPRRMGKLLGSLRMRSYSEDVDEFGKDPVYAERIEPLFQWLYEKYWRVEVEGVKNVPEEGRAVLVANHSGMLPFDGIMINEAVKSESSLGREVRFLAEDMFSTLPFLSPFLTRIGAVRACQENAERLLEQDQLVCVFPEGAKGTGKLFRERYRLQRFGRGGFIKLCMRTKAPLVPVAVLGAEEIYPIIAKFESIGKPFGLPYVPVTPTFPLLGPLGLIPFPSKWSIRFGKPVRLQKYGEDAATDEILVNRLKEDVRSRIQEMVDSMLKKRRSISFG